MNGQSGVWYCLSKHNLHDLNQFVNAFVLDTFGERADHDGSIIFDAVQMTNKFDSFPDCYPKKFVLVSDDIITFTEEPSVCHLGLRFWFSLLAVFLEGNPWCPPCSFWSDVASKSKSQNTRFSA